MASSQDAQRFQTSESGRQTLVVVGGALRLVSVVLLALGTIGALLAALAIGIALFWSRVPLRTAWTAFIWCGFALLVVAVLRQLARSAVHAAQQRGLALQLSEHGADWSGPASGSIAWGNVRHVVITRRPRGARRLLFSGDSLNVEALAAASGLTHLLRRLWTPGRFVLDLPLDRFDRPAAEVVDAIHSASAGRFPDAPTPVTPDSGGSTTHDAR